MRAHNAKRGNKGMNQFERKLSFVEKDLIKSFKEFCAKNAEEEITVGDCIQINIIGVDYLRDYGYIGFLTDEVLTDSWNNRYGRRDKDKISSILEVLRNKPAYQTYYDIDWYNNHEIKKVYFTHADSEIVHYHSFDFIKLPNGQYFDIENQYWFDIESSRELDMWMAHGWDYINPVDFLEEVYGD